MRWTRWLWVGAFALYTVGAAADDTKDKDKPHAAAASATAQASAASAAASAQADGGKHHKETPEQKKRRIDYTMSTGNKIRSIVRKDHKQVTPAEKAVIKKHWRIAMRLLKIERMAETHNKADRAKKAADLLVKEDTRFYAKLEDMNKTAPAAAASASAAAVTTAAASAAASAKPAASGGAK
jgi:hypothetical protein